MLVIPVWIGIDLSKKHLAFMFFFIRQQSVIFPKPIALILLLLVVLNWYWNIKKIFKYMISNTTFYYKPNESELERASNSYLMSLVAVIGGLPLPILNLLASIFSI